MIYQLLQYVIRAVARSAGLKEKFGIQIGLQLIISRIVDKTHSFHLLRVVLSPQWRKVFGATATATVTRFRIGIREEIGIYEHRCRRIIITKLAGQKLLNHLYEVSVPSQ
jgi:hypothetical protein